MSNQSDMITVFIFNDNSIIASQIFETCIVISMFLFLIGLGCLIVTLVKKKSSSSRWVFSNGAFYLISIGLIGILMSVPVLVAIKTDLEMLNSAYQHNYYQVVEGVVHVLHEQPETGHDKGDIISIDGKEMEIDFFLTTRAYTQTIAHGGILKEGTYARIYYFDRQILRIDIPSDLTVTNNNK